MLTDTTRRLGTISDLDPAPPGIDEGRFYAIAKIHDIKGYYSCAHDFQPRRLYLRLRAESKTVDAFRTEIALMLERLAIL